MRKIAFIFISIALIACFFIASRANNFSENLRRRSYQKTYTASRIIKNQPDDRQWNSFVDACKRMSGTKACGYRGLDVRELGETGYDLHPYIMECCKSRNCIDFKHGWGAWRNMCKQSELIKVTYSF
jgi:hypothetical protein